MYLRSMLLVLLFVTLFSVGNVNGQFVKMSLAEKSSVENIPGQANECPEGQYLDLGRGICRNLVKEFGFQPFQAKPSANEINLKQCRYSALANLVELMAPNGGTIMLPPCTIEINKTITIPDNVVLQGSGIGKTVLIAARGFEGSMLRIKQAENIIIRDLTLDGNRTYSTNIMINSAHNVLIERVETRNTTRTGISFRYTRNITIRYSSSHDHATYHGIGSKDCFPDNGKGDLKECESEAGDVSPGTLWSQNYAIYSNRLYKNADYGLDSHASHGEVAGNVIIGNERGTKFPDASQLWIHHNLIADNRDWGTRVYSTLEIPERQPRQIVYFENVFQANRGYPVSLSNPTHALYLIANQYIDNAPQRLSISDAEAYACAGTQDQQLSIQGVALSLASAEKCDLSKIGQIFGAAPGPTPASTPAPTPTRAPTSAPTVAPSPTPPPTPSPLPSPTPLSASRLYLPGRIEAENYRDGGEGVGYFDSTEGNTGGAYRADHVDIQTSAAGGNEHEVGWIDAGEWLAYDVLVTQSGHYLFSARVATWGAEERSLRIEVDGESISGSLRFDATLGNRSWTNVSTGSTYLDAGAHQVRVIMETDKFNLDYIDVTAERFTAVSRIVLPDIRRE